MKENKKEKAKGLEINSDYDFNFAVKLNPILRWILVVPMGIAGLLMVQLAGGWMVGFMLRGVAEDSIVTIIVTAIFGVFKYCIFLISMIATAPVARQNKLRTALALALIPLFVPLLIERAVNNLGYSVDSNMMALNIAVVLIGEAIAIMSVRSETQKKLPKPQPESPDEIPA